MRFPQEIIQTQVVERLLDNQSVPVMAGVLPESGVPDRYIYVGPFQCVRVPRVSFDATRVHVFVSIYDRGANPLPSMHATDAVIDLLTNHPLDLGEGFQCLHQTLRGQRTDVSEGVYRSYVEVEFYVIHRTGSAYETV